MSTEPYYQGDLNGLCGIYAVVSGFRHALDWNQHHHSDRDLFEVATKAVPKKDYPDVLWKGMSVAQLLRICKKTRDYLAQDWDYEVHVDVPFIGVEFRDLQHFIDELSSRMKSHPGAAILSLEWAKSEGGEGHWTVLERVTDKHLYLIDSGRMRRLPRRNLRVRGDRGRRICTEETVLLVRNFGGSAFNSVPS